MPHSVHDGRNLIGAESSASPVELQGPRSRGRLLTPLSAKSATDMQIFHCLGGGWWHGQDITCVSERRPTLLRWGRLYAQARGS